MQAPRRQADYEADDLPHEVGAVLHDPVFWAYQELIQLQAESLMACPHGSTVALATPESTSCNRVATYEVVLARWSVDMLRPCVMGRGGEF